MTVRLSGPIVVRSQISIKFNIMTRKTKEAGKSIVALKTGGNRTQKA